MLHICDSKILFISIKRICSNKIGNIRLETKHSKAKQSDGVWEMKRTSDRANENEDARKSAHRMNSIIMMMNNWSIVSREQIGKETALLLIDFIFDCVSHRVLK